MCDVRLQVQKLQDTARTARIEPLRTIVKELRHYKQLFLFFSLSSLFFVSIAIPSIYCKQDFRTVSYILAVVRTPHAISGRPVTPSVWVAPLPPPSPILGHLLHLSFILKANLPPLGGGS